MSDLPSTLLKIYTSALNPFPGVPLYSARGLHQTLFPIQAAIVTPRRNVNGGLINIAPPQMRKYRSEINGHDLRSPALDGIWTGDIFTFECIAELAYLTVGGSPERPVVSGSVREEVDWTYYRPILSMMIFNYSTEEDEWGRAVGWKMDAEEV